MTTFYLLSLFTWGRWVVQKGQNLVYLIKKFLELSGTEPLKLLKLLYGDGDSFFGEFDLIDMYSFDF